MSEPDNVIDLTEVRLRRQAESSDTAVNQELSWAMLSLYKQGAIEVEWRNGEALYSLKEGAEESLWEATEGPSA